MKEFDPSNEKYHSVEDLPKAKQKEYGNVQEGKGFVKQEAIKAQQLAEIKALLNERRNNPQIKVDNQALQERDVREGRYPGGRFINRPHPKQELKQETTLGVLQEEAQDMNSRRARLLMKLNNGTRPEGEELKQAIEDFNDSNEVMLALIPKLDWGNPPLHIASERLQNSHHFMVELARRAPAVLEKVPEKYKADREFVLAAITEYPDMLKFAALELQDDEEVVLTALKHEDTFQTSRPHMSVLQYASNRIKKELGFEIEELATARAA